MEILDDIIKTCNPGYITLVVKASKRCNIRPPCEYCYDYEAQTEDKRLDMNLVVLDDLIKKSVGSKDFREVFFVWHGGEPLIVGKEFYKHALGLQERYNEAGARVVNRIQTNAVALDESWVRFLAEQGFTMESSFDAFDNDTTRGHTQQVFSNLLKARDLGYPPRNTMFIATSRNLHRFREAYDFFDKQGLNFNPSPIIALGNACQASHLAITPEAYGAALTDLMDYYVAKPARNIRVRFLDAVLSAVMSGEQNLCSHGYCVYEYMAVDHKGDIFPCAKVSDKEWCFGNVAEINSFKDIFMREKYVQYKKDCEARVRACATAEDGKPCQVLQYCKGGCASNAKAAGGYAKRDFYCKTYKLVFTHALNMLNGGGEK